MDSACTIEELLSHPFKSREFKDKMQLIQIGRPCPAIPSLVSACQDSDDDQHFNVVDKYEKIPWLTGSAKIGALFCWPCLLFAPKKNTWNTTGMIDLGSFHQLVQTHEVTKSHIRAFLELQTFGATEIDSRLTAVAAHNVNVKRHRDVLVRFIDCMFYIVKCGLPVDPVRYYDSDDGEGYVLGKGNYLSTLDFISDCDPLLKSYLNKPSVFSKKGIVIKNGLIRAMATVVRNHVKKELKDIQFASVLFDEIETVDSCLLCTVVRYVSHNGEIRERFISAEDKKCNYSKKVMFDHLSSVVDELQIKDKLVSQSYDGRTVSMSEITDLCSEVCLKCRHALFVHNFNHDLQSVIESSLSDIKECRLGVICLTQVPKFFHAPKQLTALKAFLEKEYPDVLATANNFKERPLHTALCLRKELLEFFDCVKEDCTDFDTRFKAQGCISSLESFDGCFYLAFLSNIYGEIDELLRALKTDAFDSLCDQNVEAMCNQVLCHADQTFNRAWDYATNEAEEEAARPKKQNSAHSDISPRASYRIQFNKCLQNIIAQITGRFSSLDFVRFLALVNPKHFDQYKRAFPVKLLHNLTKCYPTFFEFRRLKNELTVLYSFDLGAFTHPRKLLKSICDRGLETVIPEAYRLACLCLTIPSCTASDDEPWPSTLGHFESCIKSVEQEECPSDLAFISIEVKLLLSLKEEPGFYTEVIDEFAKVEGMPEFVFYTAATWPADPLEIMTSYEEPSQYTPTLHLVESSPLSPILQETPAAERRSPVSLLDVKEEGFTMWTNGATPAPDVPLKMETDEGTEAEEFAFVAVGGDPLAWLDESDGEFKAV